MGLFAPPSGEYVPHDHTSTLDGGILTGDTHDGHIEMLAIAPPADPGADRVRVYPRDQNGYTVMELVGDTGYVRRIARDSYFVAKCTEASGISAGQLVYVSGGAGANEEIKLARADDPTTMPAAGIAQDSVANNGFCRVAFAGKVSGLDTSSVSDEGAVLYVSASVAGALVETPPGLRQRIGIVTRKHQNQGEIVVNPPGQTFPLIVPPVISGSPDAQEIVDALIALGLVTQ